MARKLVYICLVLIITGLLLTSCGRSEPECSVIEYSNERLDVWLDNYQKIRIVARVQNIGGDGVVEFKAEIASGDVNGPRSKTSSVYLEKGEEKLINFDFWVAGDGTYRVSCIQ